MAREAQALGIGARSARRCLGIAVALAAAVLLSACASASLTDAAVDDTLTTAALPPEAEKPIDTTRRSDETTIRNAVSSADLDAAAGSGLSWANADTGSRGAVTQISEAKRQGRVCRSFRASRESFDGVAMYSGETCLAVDGWKLVRFDEI